MMEAGSMGKCTEMENLPTKRALPEKVSGIMARDRTG